MGPIARFEFLHFTQVNGAPSHPLPTGTLKQSYAAGATLRGKYYADACVTLKACTAPVAFAPRTISHLVFLISLVLEQTSKDCIGNTEHSNIKVNDECNSK